VFWFVYSLDSLTAYVRMALGSRWQDGFTMSQRLQFYSPFGEIGAVAWGSLSLIFPTFVTVAMIAAGVRRSWLHMLACAGLLLIPAVFLTPLVVAQTSIISFGAPFLGATLGGALIAMRIFAANTPRWGAVLTPLVVVALALPFASPLKPPRYASGPPASRVEREYFRSIFEHVAADIARSETKTKSTVIFAFEHKLAPYPNLSILHFQRTGRFLTVNRINDLAEARTAPLIAGAEFMVTIAPAGAARTVPNLSPTMPLSVDPGAADALIRDSGRFGLISTYPVRGGEIRLYRAAGPPRPPA
jgi:hypothetical protein